MWISKKKWEALEKRVADLEKKMQSQPKTAVDKFTHQIQERFQEQLSELDQMNL